MKAIYLIAFLGVAGCTAADFQGQSVSKDVQVMGRTWTVTENPKIPNAYEAQRDNNNLQPFGKPVALRTPQAVRALQLATGCKVVPGQIRQDVSARYYANMACPG